MSNCVEVALLPQDGDADGVAVRDSKDRGGPVLTFSQDSWREFLGGIRQGQFDLD